MSAARLSFKLRLREWHAWERATEWAQGERKKRGWWRAEHTAKDTLTELLRQFDAPSSSSGRTSSSASDRGRGQTPAAVDAAAGQTNQVSRPKSDRRPPRGGRS